MKKVVLFLILFIVAIPLFSSVSYDDSVTEELRARIDSAMAKAIGDRREPDISVSGLSVDEGILTCSISYDGKTAAFISSLEYLEDEIESLFFYEESLFEEGERLDYVYKKSYSSTTLLNAGRGENYRLKGFSGKTKALFRVDEVYDDAVLLKPYFLSSSVLPGMKLEKINSLSLSLRMFSTLKVDKAGLSLSLSSSSLLYPVSSLVEAAVIKERSGYSIFLLIGIGGEFNFSSYFPTVPVLRNTSLKGEASIGVKYKGNPALSAGASVDLVYTFSRIMSLSLGIVNYDGTYYYSLTLGGKL